MSDKDKKHLTPAKKNTFLAQIKIVPDNAAYTVVFDKNGNVPAAYPVLKFTITNGQPNDYFDVQVARRIPKLLNGGPGLSQAWDKSKKPKDRLWQRAFSSWSNGEQSLRLDATGKATYTMPVDWWKDLARLPRKQFVAAKLYYRILAFNDPASQKIAKSLEDEKYSSAPSIIVKNNLKDYRLKDLGYINGGIQKSVRFTFYVREANTTEMYSLVQWNRGSIKVWGGPHNYAVVQDYNIYHYANIEPEWAIDRLAIDPRYHNGDYDISSDGLSASTTDGPGGAISNSDTNDFYSLDFQTRIHLNFEVPAAVTVTKTPDPLPAGKTIYDKAIGTIPDDSAPVPVFTLDQLEWKTRVLQVKNPITGTVATTHPETYTGPGP